MTFNIDEIKINIPEEAARDYRDTMKMDLNDNAITVYLEIARARDPENKNNISARIVEELYHEISRYSTFPGRHCV